MPTAHVWGWEALYGARYGSRARDRGERGSQVNMFEQVQAMVRLGPLPYGQSKWLIEEQIWLRPSSLRWRMVKILQSSKVWIRMLLPSALDMHELGFLQVDLVWYPRAVKIPVKHPVVSLVGFVPEEEEQARCTVQGNSDINRHGLCAVELILFW